jgi:hypothetical protein
MVVAQCAYAGCVAASVGLGWIPAFMDRPRARVPLCREHQADAATRDTASGMVELTAAYLEKQPVWSAHDDPQTQLRTIDTLLGAVDERERLVTGVADRLGDALHPQPKAVAAMLTPTLDEMAAKRAVLLELRQRLLGAA